MVEITRFGSAPPAKKLELALHLLDVHLLIEYLDGSFRDEDFDFDMI